jgi:ribulose-bisphosphate carboxylase large chain
MRIAYPLDLFDRNITDGRMMMVSFLTLVIGNNQGMGDIEHAKIYDFYMPPRAIQLFDGPSKDISDLWRILGRPVKDGGYIAGTIIKPKLGLRPEPFAKAAYQFWLGGDFIKNDEPQGNQVFCAGQEDHPAGLRRDEARHGRDRRGQAVLGQHHRRRPLRDAGARRIHPANLRTGCRQGGLPGGRLRGRPRHDHHRAAPLPNQYLHYHRAGHGAVTSPSSQARLHAYVLAKMSRLQGASGIHVGTMGYGKMEGERTTGPSPTSSSATATPARPTTRSGMA